MFCEAVSAHRQPIRVVKAGEKKFPGTPADREKCANIPPEVKARILDLRRRFNTLQDELDDLCDLIKA
ncbi:MAG TPA: hypothetical protein VK421_06095 [Pyrinomonadaceae bacterium]|nr:hypothetical protein [Pyrinomonadaceae bacterium]